ncbi:MAG: TRAP transporter large permease subunit, partial [Mailhella sp.]|nr:TRAP transporter large permease subunit [Mailhella sp.]
MTAATIGLLLFAVFFGLLFIGSPIMVALGLSTYAVYFLVGKDPVMLIQMAAASLSSFPLMALPSFILAGALMEASGMSRRLVNIAENI